MPDHIPVAVFYTLLLVIAVNLVLSGVILFREVSSRPKSGRASTIILSGLAFILGVFQLATGYYFAFDSGETAALIGCAIAYYVLISLSLTGKRMAWRLNRIVGLIGLGAPILIPVLFPISVFMLAVFGFNHNKHAFQGRISPSLSYSVAIVQPLVDNGFYYHYTLFRNPGWLPIVRKQIPTGEIDFCGVPALQVSIRPDTKDGFVRIICRQATDEIMTGKIPLDGSVPALADTGP